MREIVWDTETTGTHKGCKVVEIGAVEIQDLLPTGRTFHAYINPGVPMPKEAERVHGLGDAFLKDKPAFKLVIPKFLRFIRGARLVAHNAPFDVRVINDELKLLGIEGITNEVIDTLPLARKMFPGGKHTLDVLCAKFKISTAARTKHGALLDSELLAEAYLHLRGGRQFGLALDVVQENTSSGDVETERPPRPYRHRLTLDELAQHEAFLRERVPDPIWADYLPLAA